MTLTAVEVKKAAEDALEPIKLKLQDQETQLEERFKGYVKSDDLKSTETKLKATEDSLVKANGDIEDLAKKFASKTDSEKVIQLKSIIDENVEKIQLATKGQGVHEFNVKASVLNSTAITNNTTAYRDATLSPLAHRTLTMYDLFRKVPVTSDNNGSIRYIDWDEATTARAAAAIAEGGTFPESTAKWVELSVALQKIGDSIPVSEEMAFDSARFAGELESFLIQNVDLKIDTDLLSANGTAPNIKGLLTYISAFTPAASGITAASIYDLIEKVDEEITTNKGSKFMPNVVLMSKATMNKMALTKDSQNNYVIPPFVGRDGKEVGGKIVLRNDAVAANTLIVGDSRYGTIYEAAEGYTVTIGEVNAQFTTDMKTLKARKRLALLIKNSEVAAWRKVTSISAALVTLAT